MQFLAAPDGTPLWVSDAGSGSVPDITAAPTYALPALYKAATDGLPPLVDKGYMVPASASTYQSGGPKADPSKLSIRIRAPRTS